MAMCQTTEATVTSLAAALGVRVVAVFGADFGAGVGEGLSGALAPGTTEATGGGLSFFGN